MTASFHSLSPIQRELLDAFFAREDAFVLTGRAALVEFYLHHRDTQDLDLFARPGADIDRAEQAIVDAAGIEVDAFRGELEAKLRRMAHPGS